MQTLEKITKSVKNLQIFDHEAGSGVVKALEDLKKIRQEFDNQLTNLSKEMGKCYDNS